MGDSQVSHFYILMEKKIKVIYEKVTDCEKCPFFRYESFETYSGSGVYDYWRECGYTDQILRGKDGVGYPIPDSCPLEDYDLFHMAIDSVKNNKK